MTRPATPAPFVLGHRPWLDGLRGVAVLAVLVYHFGLFELGFLGVDVFFVISGFLITALLAQEWRDGGTIRLGAFYLRRLLRLGPALALTLAAVLALTWWLRPDEIGRIAREAVVAALYVANLQSWHGVVLTALGHCWSLSVEEQFYLLWPPLLLLAFRARLSRRALLVGVVVLILASALWRFGLYCDLPAPGEANDRLARLRVYTGLDTRADALSCGCLVGLLAVWGALPRSAGVLRAVGVSSLLVGAALLVAGRNWHFASRGWYQGGFLVAAVAASGLMVCLLGGGLGRLRKMLEWPPLTGVGRISYGLYLAHVPVLYLLCGGRRPGASWLTLAALALTFAVALASYFVVERPFLRLKGRVGAKGRNPASRGAKRAA